MSIITITEDDRRLAKIRRRLESWELSPGTKAKNVRSKQVAELRGSAKLGQVLICSACTKVVGWWEPLGDAATEHSFFDQLAGWVLERRRFMFAMNVCGSNAAPHCEACGQSGGNCGVHMVFEYPLACSDECERQVLIDQRFDVCPPPFGYQRGGPHP